MDDQMFRTVMRGFDKDEVFAYIKQLEADAEQRDGEHHGADVPVVAGEEHRAAYADEDTGADAGEYLFQIRHIFSSLSFTAPTI